MELISGVGAFVVGAAIAWLLASSRAEARLQAARAEFEPERAALLERTKALGSRLEESIAAIKERETLAELRAREISTLQSANAELSERLIQERKSAAEKLDLLRQAETTFTETFKALSGEALKSNNQAFIHLAKSILEKFQDGAKSDLESRQKAVDELVKPIRESLDKVDGKLGEIEKARVSAYSALDEQLRGLVQTHLPMLRNETANLVKALRQPAVRGRWGEIQLRRVVEMAGMVDHCDFKEQESITTEEGRLRPDLVVRCSMPSDWSRSSKARAPDFVSPSSRRSRTPPTCGDI